MGSVRNSRKEKEITLDPDCVSFFGSFAVHVVLLLVMACLYDRPAILKKIALSLDFNESSSSSVNLEKEVLLDLDELASENQPAQNLTESVEAYIPPSGDTEISSSLSEIFSDAEKQSVLEYTSKDLLATVSKTIADTKIETEEPRKAESNSDAINNSTKILTDLAGVTGSGVRFNRNQPNPFANLNGTGSSIEARLKAAGAKTGEIQISIAWNTVDDIDLHVSYSPGNGLVDNINWINRIGHTSGGMLDIDMNANSNLLNSNPVENVFWPKNTNLSGYYSISIHFYRSWTGSRQVPVAIRVKARENIQTFNLNAILHSSPQRVTDFKY